MQKQSPVASGKEEMTITTVLTCNSPQTDHVIFETEQDSGMITEYTFQILDDYGTSCAL